MGTRRTAIVGGTVVGPSGSFAGDVLLDDGLVAEVGQPDLAGAAVVEADGCLVLPGGVDAHTHVFGAVRSDTRSALCGGTTTAIAFVDALPGERLVDAARRTLADEVPETLVDLALHTVVWEPSAFQRGDLRDVAELGIGSVKLWLAYSELGIMADDGVAFTVMQEASELGMVVLAHCENGRVVEVLTEQLADEGRLGIDSLPLSRPIALEAECIHRFLVLAELAGATPYVVHVTGRRPLDEIEAARDRGLAVHAEVCPHHLLFDESDQMGPDAIRFVMTPPLRERDDRAALLEGMTRGALDTFASDHCHYRLDRDKLPAQDDFRRIPTGLPGIGARLSLGFALCASNPRCTVERLVELSCAAPARVFGLYPKKGVIATGSDADIVVWDPAAPGPLTLNGLEDGLGWSPYEGVDIPGSVRHVFARGEHVIADGSWRETEHRGQYLAVQRAARVLAP